ncbi:DUF4365 domain-containing protein [Sorangium sp. So ce429]
MAAVDTNSLGERGEQIAFLALTSLHGNKPLFRPSHLGAKWPVADFVVELDDLPGRVFLLQVKTTQGGIGKWKQRISVDVDAERLRLLLGAPMPAYVVAVHEPTKSAYVALPKTSKRIRSLSTKFSLDAPTVRQSLYDEVKKFWTEQATPFAPVNSMFSD